MKFRRQIRLGLRCARWCQRPQAQYPGRWFWLLRIRTQRVKWWLRSAMIPNKLWIAILLPLIPTASNCNGHEQLWSKPRRFQAGGPINDIAFSPDGKWLALGRYDYVTLKKTATEERLEFRGQLEVWDVDRQRPARAFSIAETAPVDNPRFSSKGNAIFYISRADRVCRLNVTTRSATALWTLNTRSTFWPASPGFNTNAIFGLGGRSSNTCSLVTKNPSASMQNAEPMLSISRLGDSRFSTTTNAVACLPLSTTAGAARTGTPRLKHNRVITVSNAEYCHWKRQILR